MSTVNAHTSGEINENEASSPKWCTPYLAKGKLVQFKVNNVKYQKNFTISVLKLDKPLNILAGVCDGENHDPLSNVKEIQIKELGNVMSKYIGKTIIVSGELSYPQTVEDSRDVIMYSPVEIQAVK